MKAVGKWLWWPQPQAFAQLVSGTFSSELMSYHYSYPHFNNLFTSLYSSWLCCLLQILLQTWNPSRWYVCLQQEKIHQQTEWRVACAFLFNALTFDWIDTLNRCRRQFAKYTCPTCNVPYCSLTCFGSQVRAPRRAIATYVDDFNLFSQLIKGSQPVFRGLL